MAVYFLLILKPFEMWDLKDYVRISGVKGKILDLRHEVNYVSVEEWEENRLASAKIFILSQTSQLLHSHQRSEPSYQPFHKM